MRKAAFLYNPDSGGQRAKRKAELESVLALLRAAGIEVELMLPHSAAEAQEQAKDSIRRGCDTVLAGGGDGTIHNIVQVLANTPVALAILPLGTANALAHDLGLPMNVFKAAQALTQSKRRRIALGRVGYRNLSDNPETRFFGSRRRGSRCSPFLQAPYRSQAAHGDGSLLCQGVASVVYASDDAIQG